MKRFSIVFALLTLFPFIGYSQNANSSLFLKNYLKKHNLKINFLATFDGRINISDIATSTKSPSALGMQKIDKQKFFEKIKTFFQDRVGSETVFVQERENFLEHKMIKKAVISKKPDYWEKIAYKTFFTENEKNEVVYYIEITGKCAFGKGASLPDPSAFEDLEEKFPEELRVYGLNIVRELKGYLGT